MTIKTLDDQFTHMLQDMYYAEGRILETLPEMSENATDSDLQNAFDAHADETKVHVTRLERVFKMLDKDIKGEKCEAIEGILKEGKKLMSESKSGDIRDSALIAAAQKVEHYEIASYGALCSIAKRLGYDEAAEVLHSTLDEEKETDEKLSSIARDIEDNAISEAA